MQPNQQEAQRLQDSIQRMGAHDVYVLWNPVIERWQVLQVGMRPGGIKVPGRPGSDKRLYLMWTIEKQGGDYRVPGFEDELRMRKTLEHTVKLRDIGAEKYTDELEASEDAYHKRVEERRNAQIGEMSKRMVKGFKTGRAVL